ncbi:cytochrome C oxidase subunit III [Mycolicibacterium iranicum]|uniref:Probable cytochrome c oxidase subunit 3 n=2 Tax=Mycolicibacterium iranicum TaxID=912594 RepID=A0A1X1W3N9_MYCIR|nr:cytochrome c oxidase subunit 3 [Mycolicibacterium iranicum]ORV81161.1 cytochrome C oxidase subunit III [Mycolicibacterium iranicum]
MSDTQAQARSTAGAPGTGHLPGDVAIWVMVLGDLIIFGSYFVIFMVHRTMAAPEFLAAQQHLNLTIGALNTVVLLTSSWFVARSVVKARAGDIAAALRLTYFGGACGVAFIAIKAYEWTAKITAGQTMGGSSQFGEFFNFYYMLTGVHLFHVLLGLLIMGIVVRELRNPRKRRMSMVESGAIYWHMVDLLWVVIFGLLYVMR